MNSTLMYCLTISIESELFTIMNSTLLYCRYEICMCILYESDKTCNSVFKLTQPFLFD